MSAAPSSSHREHFRDTAKQFLKAHHPTLPRSHKSSEKTPKLSGPDYEKKKEEEKHLICQWESDNQKSPLSPSQISKDPNEKLVGHSSKVLRKEDFKLIKTIGTGTFARVWLAKLADPPEGEGDKVFALKILRKVDVIKLKQVEHVRNERAVLAAVAGHPFITTMVASFHDHDSLYMILDYCPGGEIFSYLRRAKRFEERVAKFYAAEICLILEFLHKEGVAYRDLKPENILIDAEGHLKLVDFGFAKRLDGRQTWTLCGTPEYLAPETIRNTGTSTSKMPRPVLMKSKGHSNAVDWWAFGILIYEFLVGQPPFWDQNPMKIYEQICHGKLSYPNAMGSDAKDIIGKLCEVNPAKRLGNLRGHADDVKSHSWFSDIDFKKLYWRDIEGPIIPHLQSHDDTRNFESYDLEPERRTVYTPDLAKKHDALFECF
ncbi:MAG: serine/threonine protein kinase, AGC [Alyxoria varia]|nr:MAG: serine/threonine protein kinase, AGC [Alyxoria varia]